MGSTVYLDKPEQFFRKEDYADKIDTNIRHTGWYADDDYFETYRGVVFRLAKGRGFLAGYEELEHEKNNTDGAIVELDIISDKEQAARTADRLAEIAADKARDYNRAWQAGRRVETLKEDIAGDWEKIRRYRKEPFGEARNVAIRWVIGSIRGDQQEIEKLTDDFGNQEGFTE